MMKQRILRIITVFFMALLSCANLWAQSSGLCGPLTWTLDNNGVLTISGTGDMDYYYPPYSPWIENSTIKKVVIEDGVTSIGKSAFYGCSGLTSVEIPNSVTSIGKSAFYNCSSLTNLTIPNSVTSIESSTFYKCSGLKSVTIPNSVTSIGESAFYGCSSLTSATFNAEKCTTMGNMTYPVFDQCTSLKTLTIGNKVTAIPDYAFLGCSGLTNVEIPNSVTNIGELAFI